MIDTYRGKSMQKGRIERGRQNEVRDAFDPKGTNALHFANVKQKCTVFRSQNICSSVVRETR